MGFCRAIPYKKGIIVLTRGGPNAELSIGRGEPLPCSEVVRRAKCWHRDRFEVKNDSRGGRGLSKRAVTVTYDGSGERAGLNFYLNGRVIPTQGSEYFEKLKGNIRTVQPILLGKQVRKDDDVYFAGGAIADFRIFNRAITVEEARLVSLWPALKRARKEEPSGLTEDEREVRRRGAVTHVMQERSDSNAFGATGPRTTNLAGRLLPPPGTLPESFPRLPRWTP